MAGLPNIKKQRFLDLIKNLGSHSLYHPKPLCKDLAKCGLAAFPAPEGEGLYIEGELIPLSQPEWGKPGVSRLSILATVYELEIGERPDTSFLNGIGFKFRLTIELLNENWG